MNKLFTKIVGVCLGLTMAVGVGVAVASNSEAVPVHAATQSLTFDLTKNPGDWPTTASATLSNYTYTLSGTSYTFGLKNVKCNSGYLMLNYTAALGLPAIDGYKLTKVVAKNSGGCSTSTKVGISSSASSASYISGGAIQTWSTTNSSYTYTLSGTENKTVYYLYVTNKNAQITELALTYEPAATKTLSSIAVTSSSHRTFAKNDTFVKETITATYSDSSTADVTSSASFSGYNMSTTGSQTVSVSYTEGGTTKTATYTITVNDPRTVTSLEVLDDETNELSDGDEVSLTATGESVSTDITCGVTYTSGSPDGAVTITSSPSTNFALTTEDDETYTLTFTANGDYNVTIAAAADDNYSITVTYSVNGITASIYKKVTSAGSLKSGSQIIIGKSDGNYVLEKYVSGNNCPAGFITPTDADTIPASALTSNTAILTLSGSAGSWTLTDQDDRIYYGTDGQNRLQASSTATDTWTIQISDGVATMYSAATGSGRCLRKNNNSNLFACYTSAQHGISIYMLPSNNPEIDVDVASGSTSLSVNGTATLTATLKNTTGTVTWSLVDNTPTGTGNVAQISADGNSVTVTGKKDGTVKVRAALTGCDNVDTLFTVTKALSSIAVTTAPTKTTYT